MENRIKSTTSPHKIYVQLWYGVGAGNTVEENSSVFSLIRMR